MPVTLGTFEGLAGVSGRVPAKAARHPGRVENHVTLAALNSSLSAIDMVRASSNGGSLEHVCVGRNSHGRRVSH